MADGEIAGGAPAAPQAAAAAQTPAQTNGTGGWTAPVTNPADWAEINRFAQIGRGAQPFYEAARQRGFNKPEDFGTLDKLRERGITLDRLSSMFDEPPAQNGRIDADELKAEMMAELRKEIALEEEGRRRETAMGERDRMLKSWYSELPNSVKKMIGEDGVESDAELLRLAAIGAFAEPMYFGDNVPMYENGHVLHGHALKPTDSKSIDERLSKILTDRKAQVAAKIGKAANKTPTQTPAGRSGGQGAPEGTNAKKRLSEMTPQEKEALGASKIAKFAGGSRPV